MTCDEVSLLLIQLNDVVINSVTICKNKVLFVGGKTVRFLLVIAQHITIIIKIVVEMAVILNRWQLQMNETHMVCNSQLHNGN